MNPNERFFAVAARGDTFVCARNRMMNKDVVDELADVLQERYLSVAPRLPDDVEKRAWENAEAAARGYRVKRRGNDIDGRPFIEIEKIDGRS